MNFLFLDTLPVSAVKTEPFSLPANAQSLDYNQLFGRSHAHLSSLDLQSKLAAVLCSSSSRKDSLPSNSPLSKLTDPPEIPDAPKVSSQLNIKGLLDFLFDRGFVNWWNSHHYSEITPVRTWFTGREVLGIIWFAFKKSVVSHISSENQVFLAKKAIL